MEKLARDDLSIVSAMNRFADLGDKDYKELEAMSDDELKILGWTRKKLRIAYAARLPRAAVPYALQAAHERTGMRIRKSDQRPENATINVAIIRIPEAAPRKRDDEVEIIEAKVVRG
jgi:hypothetical protein